MTERLLLVTSEAIGPARTAELMGESYRVVPAVLVRSQVLINNLGATFLPPEELTHEWAQQWNGAPVVVHEHPSKRGFPVSAKSPEVLNALGIGFVFNAAVDEDVTGLRRLKAEVWLKLARAKTVAELQEILNRVDKGEPVELSTGFPTLAEETAGVHNGQAYSLILRPNGVDHLAVFAESIGACSVADGCGLGVNHAGPCTTEERNNMAVETAQEQEAAIAPVAEQEQEEQAANGTPEEGTIRKVLNFLGFRRPAQNAESDEDRRQLLYSALKETFGGLGKWVWIEAVFSEDGYIVFEVENENPGGDAGLYRVDFTVSEDNAVTFADPVPVRRRTVFEPVADEEAADATNRGGQGDTMDRETLIAALVEAGPLGRDALQKLSDCDLKVLQSGSKAETVTETPAANAAPVQDNSALLALETSINALAATVTELQQKIATHEEAVAPAVEERTRQRGELLAELLGNERVLNAYPKADLEAMSFENLDRVRTLVRGESYAGRGGPRAVAGNSTGEVLYMEPRAYHETAAPAAKEA